MPSFEEISRFAEFTFGVIIGLVVLWTVFSVVGWARRTLKDKKIGEEMLFSVVISAMGLAMLPIGVAWLIADAIGYYPYAATAIVSYLAITILTGRELHRFWENEEGFFRLCSAADKPLRDFFGFCENLFFRVGNVFGIFPNIG